MKLEINTKLLPVKAIYFLTLAGLACLIPFLPVYMHHLGLTAAEIGAIRGLEPLVNFIFCPLWGAFADKFNKHKPVLIGSLLASGFFLFVTFFIPTVDEVNKFYHTGSHRGSSGAVYNYDSNNLTVTGNETTTGNFSFEIGCNATTGYSLLSAFCNNFYFFGEKSMALTDTCHDICDASKSSMSQASHQMQNQAMYSLDERTNQTNVSSEEQLYDCHVCLQQRRQQKYLSDGLDYGSGIEIVNPLFFQSECHLQQHLQHHENSERTLNQPNSSRCEGAPNVTRCPNQMLGLSTSTYSSACIESYQCYCKPSYDHDNTKGIGPSETYSITFTLMLFFVLFAKIFNCNIFPILDSTVMELLQDARRDYSKQKVWGTVGWGMFALTTGAIIDGVSHNTRTVQFSPAFYLYLAFVIAAACVAAVLVFPPHTSNRTMILNSMGLLRQPCVVTFLALVFVLGFSFGIIGTFLFLYLEELGSLYTLMGLTLTVTCISEIPVFFFSGHLIKYLGHNNVLYLTLVCYAIRFLGYSLVRNPWIVVPLELLHGITYGAAWATCSGYANVCAPPGMAANLQSLFSVTHMGLGKGLGALFGGAIYHWLGGRNLFRISAGLCLLSAIVFFLLQNYVIKKGLRYSRFHDICDGSDKMEESRDETAPSEFDQCRLEIEESDFNSRSVDAHAMQLALGTITEMPFPDSDDPSDPSGSSAIEMSVNGKRPSWHEEDSSPNDDDESLGTSSPSELLILEGRLPTIGREDSGLEGAVRLPAVGVEDDDYNTDDTTTLILPHGGKCTTV